MGTNPTIQTLTAKHCQTFDVIIETLTERASGVFLWAVLACKSVLEHVSTGNGSISEL